jgi:hypothetical protein
LPTGTPPGRKAVYAAGDTWAQLAWILPLAIAVVRDIIIDIRAVGSNQARYFVFFVK